MNSATTNQFIDVPADERNAIIDALYRFAMGQDTKDRALFESAFSEAAELDFVGPAARLGVEMSPFSGRAMIADIVMGSTAGLDTTHTVTNLRVTSHDGQRASLYALVEAQHLPREDHTRHLMLKNEYRCELSREYGQWVIDLMKIDCIWVDGQGDVLFPELAAA